MGRWLLALLPVATLAAAAGDLPPDRHLGSLQYWSNAVARAFMEDGHIRLYFTNAGQGVMFKASWEKSRVKAQEFSFASTTLKVEKSPPPVPAAKSSWREVPALAGAESVRFLRAGAMRVVPAEPGHGLYGRYAFGDAVLFRGTNGDVQLVAAQDKPPEIQIDRRYSRQELASLTAETIEGDLRKAYPNATAFVLTLGHDTSYRMVVLDLARRQAVVLYSPAAANDSGSFRLGGNLSTLASFAVVDNGWAFLKNPVSSSLRTLNQGLQWTRLLLRRHLRVRSSTIPPLTLAPGMDLVAWEQWLDRNTGSRRELGSVRLLIDGDRFYPVLEQRIAEARSNINFHVCIFDNDDVAVDIANRLKQRSTNVIVKVIYDRMITRGASASPPATPMREGFVPPGSISSYLRDGSRVRVRPQPNPGLTMDHTKVLLIDDRYAYIGGMNIGREYRYEWHDLMAEVEGPVVASLRKQFDKKWAQLGIWGDCGLAAEFLSHNEPAPEVAPAPGQIEVRRLYTRTFDRQIRRAELEAIRRASNHVFVENTYIFNNEMIIALARARLRGVDVRVVMPAESDVGPGHKTDMVTANYLLNCGVRVYFYPGMTHVKAMQADDWTCFGSANFDAMSLRLNREADLASSDAGFAEQFRKELFEMDFVRSHELKEPVSVSLDDHLADALLALF